jgi:hypothetical protein
MTISRSHSCFSPSSIALAPRKILPKKAKRVNSTIEDNVGDKGSKGGKSGKGFALVSPWDVLTTTATNIEALVQEGFLAPKALLGYQCALGQDMLAPNFSEIMVFVIFF